MRRCPYCQAITRQVKEVKPKGGAQQYRCRHCNGVYTVEAELSAATYSGAEKPVFAMPMDELPPTLVHQKTPATVPTNAMDEYPPTLVHQQVRPARTLIPISIMKEMQAFSARTTEWAGTMNAWGRLPEIALLQSAGLLLLAWAFAARRALAGSSQPFLWIGLAALIVPIAIRLASAEPTRRERIGLVLLLGMSLYMVKALYSPMAFTFPDELSHIRNVNEILRTHRLFQENPSQPVTAFYPGLPIVTSTVSSLSGLSTFGAGILVIGIARLILFLSLFLLYEQVSGSARIAGLGVLLYIANPNFLYWISEYAYEPLALPMLTFVLLAVAKRETANDRRQTLAWTIAALAGILTVVITHHMSSYIMTGLLIVLVIFYAVRSRGKRWGPWDLALVSAVATSLWLTTVARFTIEYLSPVLFGVFQSTFNLVAEQQQSRELFTSGSTGRVAPLWEQVVALGSVVVIASGLPFGLYETWKNHRSKIFALLLAMIAMVYLPMQLLRFTKAGWETSNRSSEFLFIGIGFVLAIGLERFWWPKWSGQRSRTVLAVVVVALFFGGLISGWPPRARWPRPYVVSVDQHLVQPQVVSVAQWLLATLGPNHHIAASKADAKILNAYDQYPFTDNGSAIKKMFSSEAVGAAEQHTLVKRSIEYVMSDRKVVSWDHMLGYYFYNQLDTSSSDLKLIEQSIFQKFDTLNGVNRILDAGDIVVYDVRSYISSSPEQTKAASSPPRSKLHAKIPAVITGRTSELAAQLGYKRPSIVTEIHATTPMRLSGCVASSDASNNPFQKWTLVFRKLQHEQCLGG